MGYLISLIYFVGQVLIWLIIARSLISWFRPMGYHPWYVRINRFLYETTEWIIEPIRRLMPRTGMVDFSPFVAIVVIWIILSLIGRL